MDADRDPGRRRHQLRRLRSLRCDNLFLPTVRATNVVGDSAYTNTASATTFKLDQAITFGALAAKTYGDAPFALTATASSGLAVSYGSSNTAVANVFGNTVTLVGVGTATITAFAVRRR